MTPAQVPESFERVMGCEARELLAWLPAALPGAETTLDLSRQRVHAHFPEGTLTLTWNALEPRRIARLRIPQLRVSFRYAGIDEHHRHAIQGRFDLATQRGGG